MGKESNKVLYKEILARVKTLCILHYVFDKKGIPFI